MKDTMVQKFTSECGRLQVLFDPSMPVGEFHDFLLFLKGNVVNAMNENQRKEVENNEAFKAAKPKEEVVQPKKEE